MFTTVACFVGPLGGKAVTIKVFKFAGSQQLQQLCPLRLPTAGGWPEKAELDEGVKAEVTPG
jgi:hypothetical protein